MPREMKLRPYQTECINGLRAGARAGHRAQILYAPTGAGKCLGRGTPVLMFDGRIKAVEDVMPGDQLMGPDSTPRRVLSCARGVGQLFMVRPTKGDPYVVNDAHILSLKITGGATKWDCSRSDKYLAGKIHNVSVIDYLAESMTFRHCAKGWRVGVDFTPRSDSILPAYFLGVWLGDGLSRWPAVCSADPEIVAAVRAVAEQNGLNIRIEKQNGNRSVVAHITSGQRGGRPENPVLEELARLGLIQNKHIPHEYLTASRASRLDLLAGLIDTDGCVSRGGFDFIQKNERLAREVAFLARSLGLAAYVSAARKTCGNNGVSGDYWRVSISGDCSVVPVRLARRRAPPRTIKKDPLLVGIRVEPIGEGDYFGFEIDGDRLFLLGDFTVTHNTVVGSFLMNEARKKGSRVAFVVDRVNLVDQTSQSLDEYGIPHGVVQAGHWRRRGYEPIQVCSAQTLEKRGFFPELQLLIVDECHAMRKETVKLIKNRPDLRVVGLTATPFTKGLGEVYTNVVTVTTTDELIAEGWLVPLKLYAAKAIDMTGAKIVAGEWAEREIERRGREIIGDIVAEWVDKTRLHFGGPVKTIVFAATVDHGEELCRQFNAAGFNFQQISYRDANEERRRELISEFRKPNSAIDGLVSCEVFTKGFDVPDVMCGIAARPYRKSLSSHIQQMGRVMRPARGKTFGLWLDHCGNVLRFKGDTDDVFANGCGALDSGEKDAKARKEPTEKERELIRCQCGFVLSSNMRVCPSCGHERIRRSLVETVAGVMVEIGGKKTEASGKYEFLRDQDRVWREIAALALDRKHGDVEAAQKFAQAQYRNIYGAFARRQIASTEPIEPSAQVSNLVRHNIIRWAKSRARAAA